MRARTTVAALSIILGLHSVSFAGSSAESTGPPSNYSLADVTISLSRTSCMGTCPVYRLTLRGTGTYTFSGHRFVGQVVDTTVPLDQQVIVDLLNDLNAMYFFDMRDRYTERTFVRLLPTGELQHLMTITADDPHLILSVQIGSYTKTVEKNLDFGPGELVAVAAKIDKVTNSAQWTTVKGR